jgi:hypothetical protein
VAWIDVDFQGDTQIGYTFSTNDGATFSAPSLINSPMGRVGSDPVLAVDASGNIYVTWVGYFLGPQGPAGMRIYVSKANAGSTTFGPPILVSPQNDNQALYDKPWITVSNGGTVLVTYQRSGAPNAFGIVAARSNDGGASWQRTFVVNDTTGSLFRNLAFPCAPKNGNHIWVTYLGFNGVDFDTRLSRSDDGGASWSPETIVSLANEPVAFDDPSCAGELDEVWVAYGLSLDPLDDTTSSTQKLHSIQLAYSSNGGQSILTRGEIADLSSAKYFMHPQITREDSGALDIVYYAGQSDEDSNAYFRRDRATPPMLFPPSSVVEHPVTFLQARGDPRWLGDYVGIHTRNGRMYTSYVVNTSGLSQVAFGKYTVP